MNEKYSITITFGELTCLSLVILSIFAMYYIGYYGCNLLNWYKNSSKPILNWEPKEIENPYNYTFYSALHKGTVYTIEPNKELYKVYVYLGDEGGSFKFLDNIKTIEMAKDICERLVRRLKY